ncbi:hypothetical protein PP707_07980 [Acetobacter pasteurianus]|nr:hypothetical protein [Acetobacter pasteurianus]
MKHITKTRNKKTKKTNKKEEKTLNCDHLIEALKKVGISTISKETAIIPITTTNTSKSTITITITTTTSATITTKLLLNIVQNELIVFAYGGESKKKKNEIK